MLLRNLKSKSLGASRHALMAAALATTVALAGVTASQPAAADGIITDWDFEINNGFFSMGPDAFTPAGLPPAGVVGSVPNVDLSAANAQSMWTHLEWGNASGTARSSIDVGSASAGNFMGSVATNGGPVNTVMISHNNQVVPTESTKLATATLLDVLTLTATADEMGAVAGTTFTVGALLFDIWFKETVNGDSPCEPPTVGPPGNCSDIFAIDVTGAGFVANNGDVEIVQDISGDIPENDENFLYEAIITIEDLQTLAKESCDAAGMPLGVRINAMGECYGLITSEGMNNTFQVSLEIRGPEIVDMPEPGSLALLAFGLAGLGFAGRRKRLA